MMPLLGRRSPAVRRSLAGVLNWVRQALLLGVRQALLLGRAWFCQSRTFVEDPAAADLQSFELATATRQPVFAIRPK